MGEPKIRAEPLTKLKSHIAITCCGLLLLTCCPAGLGSQSETQRHSLSVFPIAIYDSDIGYGLGGMGVLKNCLRRSESFELTLFASSKGEQWYVFGFSMPDREMRQGTAYRRALDIRVEFDKLLKSNFFPVGNDSRNNDHRFPREFSKITLSCSRAFTARLVGEIGARFTHYSVYGWDPAWGTISATTPGAGESDLVVLSPAIRYDSRDSHINPSHGVKLELRSELCSRRLGLSLGDIGFSFVNVGNDGRWDFVKLRLELGGYRAVLPGHIIAARIWMQQVNGRAPYQELSAIGGGWTARGYKAERFLDRAMALSSLEYRFPLYRRLGALAFVDGGRVWNSLKMAGFNGWHFDGGAGLRYHLENFVARLDAGFSPEGIGLFVNFGQVF